MIFYRFLDYEQVDTCEFSKDFNFIMDYFVDNKIRTSETLYFIKFLANQFNLESEENELKIALSIKNYEEYIINDGVLNLDDLDGLIPFVAEKFEQIEFAVNFINIMMDRIIKDMPKIEFKIILDKSINLKKIDVLGVKKRWNITK